MEIFPFVSVCVSIAAWHDFVDLPSIIDVFSWWRCPCAWRHAIFYFP
jgi:hypothetical protein